MEEHPSFYERDSLADEEYLRSPVSTLSSAQGVQGVSTHDSGDDEPAQGGAGELTVGTRSLSPARASPTPSTEDHTATTFSVSNPEQSRALERDHQATPERTQSEDAPPIYAIRAASTGVSLAQLSSSITSASSGSSNVAAPPPCTSDANDNLDLPTTGIPPPATTSPPRTVSLTQPPAAMIDETDRDLEAGPSTSSPVDEGPPSV